MTPHQLHQRSAYFGIIGALISWLGLGLEFFVVLQRALIQGQSFQHALSVFFSFFTNLTNILVAVAFTAISLSNIRIIRNIRNVKDQAHIGRGNFFARPFILGGIAPSIALVGIIYNLVLRQLWHPTGWGRVADELLHVIVPLGFVIYWFLCVPKAELRWRDSLIWALYPIAYLMYALIHGDQSGVYAYPFIDVATIGYGAVMINSVGILIGFLAMAFIFIAFDRRKKAANNVSSKTQ